uniref:Replication-associated protein n=1 Tax=Syrmaticus reevesii CRESS-DNA-virus sp. TaxID=2815059 RepID=A0A8A4XBH8_9VIRU|nr:MAG: replication-associated protein [Syrmaticus reevesii CRESS-DNA-virus sp.]
MVEALWQPESHATFGSILHASTHYLDVPRSGTTASIVSFYKMRSYSKSKAFPKTVVRPTRKEVANREATEWDVRLDVNEGFTSAHVLEHAVAHQDKFTYCLIGDVENPDVETVVNGSKETHVHVAIIMAKPSTREAVLQLLRGARKRGDEYAAPRNPRFTYAGWVMHHTKTTFKINPDGPFVLYENGDLPEDAFDEKTCWAVVRMMKKFGNPDMKQRFKKYSTMLDALKTKDFKETLAVIPPVADNYILPQ